MDMGPEGTRSTSRSERPSEEGSFWLGGELEYNLNGDRRCA